MASNLELKKTQAELMGVSHAKFNIEIRIEELQNEIERLREAIVVQSKKEEELNERIQNLVKK